MDYKFRTISREAFIADLQRIGFDPYSGQTLNVESIITEEKVKIEKEINDNKKNNERIPDQAFKRVPNTDEVWERIKQKLPEKALENISRIEDKIKYQGYSQDFDACIRWNGILIIGQEFDVQGNITNEGTEIEGLFVDVRTEEPLQEGFESLMQDTVLDDRYPHTFS